MSALISSFIVNVLFLNYCEHAVSERTIMQAPQSKWNEYPTFDIRKYLPGVHISGCEDFKQLNVTKKDLCPDGTTPHCVENKIKNKNENEILFICKPTDTCDKENSKYILVGEKSCKRGYQHRVEGDCFKACDVWDARIRVFKKATKRNAALVYCDYEYRYCNPTKPKVFELTRETDVCTLRLDKLCSAGMDRLPDCSCDVKCKHGFARDPMDDFKCKQNDSYASINSREEIALINIDDIFRIINFTVSPHFSNLRVSWCVDRKTDVRLKHIEISYRADGSVTNNDMPNLNPEDDCQCQDVKNLFAGKKYLFSVSFVIDYKGIIFPVKRHKSGVTKPKPNKNLNKTLTTNNVCFLNWFPPDSCEFDSFLVEERGNEVEVSDTSYTIKLTDAIPGDKYTFNVYTISNGIKSSKREAVVILPPLPPRKLHEFFLRGGNSETDREITWFKVDTKVDAYLVTYNSTAERISKSEYLLVSRGQTEISFLLINLKPGKNYDFEVKAQSEGVNSTYSAQCLISIPYDDDEYFTNHLKIIELCLLSVRNKVMLQPRWTNIRSRHVIANIDSTGDHSFESPSYSSEDEQ